MKVNALSLAVTALLTVSACSKQDTPVSTPVAPTSSAAASMSSYDTVAAKGRGFTVGSLMSAQTIYVLFEPQCRHCSRLWQASVPLLGKAKFVWIPLSFSAQSLPQGAALMTASNPLAAMSAHEESLLADKGGISAPANVAPDIEQAIKANGELLTSLGVDSVPFLVTKNRRTGEVVSHNGALDTPELAQLVGLD